MPCAGALECGGQNWNDGRVGLRRRQGELKIIGGRVPNCAWAPILVFDFNQVKTFHAVRDAPTGPNDKLSRSRRGRRSDEAGKRRIFHHDRKQKGGRLSAQAN
jgi:hypothetical protein